MDDDAMSIVATDLMKPDMKSSKAFPVKMMRSAWYRPKIPVVLAEGYHWQT
jgi:hypothetical protein